MLTLSKRIYKHTNIHTIHIHAHAHTCKGGVRAAIRTKLKHAAVDEQVHCTSSNLVWIVPTRPSLLHILTHGSRIGCQEQHRRELREDRHMMKMDPSGLSNKNLDFGAT